MRLRWTILVLLLIFTGNIHSQVAELRFEKFTTTNGLPDNNTNIILQDTRGFVWIGGYGLTRYDGRLFKQYTSLGKNGLTDLSTNCFTEDSEGNIWIGTNSGLNKLNPFTETITHYYQGTGPGTIPFNWCNYLYIDNNKTLWLTSEKGIAQYDKKTNSFQNFPVSVYGADEKINKFIYRVFEDSKNRFWLVTSYGVKLFDRKTKTYQSYHFNEPAGQSLKENVIISLQEDHKGTIWAGTWGGGLLKFNPGKNIFEKLRIENSPAGSLGVSDISEIQVNNNKLLSIIINGKLYFLNLVNNKYYLEPVQFHALNKGDYFPADNIFSNLMTDRQGNVWISGNGGLYKIRPANFAFQWFKVNSSNSTKSFIFHIIPDIKDPKTIFYLTSTNGWWQYNAAAGTITTKQLPPHENQLLKYINDWTTDEKGYWFTSVEGFGYYNIYDNHLTDLTAVIEEKSGQPNTGFITKDAMGKLWISMRRAGILVYDPATKKSDVLFTDTSGTDNILGKSVTDIKYHNDGYIYLCVPNKLYKVNTSDYSYKIIRPPAYEEQINQAKITPEKILVTKDNRLLVSSYLRIYELKNDRLTTIFPATGLSPFTIKNITADSSGFIWVNTSKGMFKTDITFTKWINISSRTGWEDEDEGFSEINTTRPGEILFNGNGQIGVLKDSLLQKNSVPPVVIITRVIYGEKQNNLVSLNPVTIRSSYKDAIELELSSIDFLNQKENKIIYRLDGWDKNWKELTGTSFIRYEQLPPGDYTFITKTVNTEGAESKETLLNFTVVPPFYRTWWFISLAILTIAGILFATYRYRLQKALEMERLRTRIATDLHDDIGATLSSISFYSETIKQQTAIQLPQLTPMLDKMGETSREMVGNMSDIVWDINPQNDSFEKMLGRMQNLAAGLCAVKNIQLHFTADEKLIQLQLPMEQRRNIYLIFKEALNNALKYAGCSNMRIDLRKESRSLVLSVKDDGKGFNETAVAENSQGGNGLKNMRQRATEIKGELIIDSEENKGTHVLLKTTIT